MTIGLAKMTRGLVAVTCLMLGLLTTTSSGQTVGGTFIGRVRDQSAATLPYANVSITNVATGVVTSVVTNADGFYTAPNLLPGTYTVTAAFDGFNSQTKSGLTLTVGAELPVDFDMTVGNVSETLQVAGQSATVDTCPPRCVTT